jgi:hypothetical protein
MEARLAIVCAAVFLIRLPFLHQAIQGDDVYYLAMARNALVDPMHPMQMGYTFQGARVSMAGHPHPPLNACILALLLRSFGGVREIPFHIAYIGFSLIAAISMYALARRFTTEPLLAALLFVSVPAFVVNGNSLEADLPFLALWMAGFAFYFEGRHRLAAGSLALAALAAYQAVFAAPILAHHAWRRRRRSKTAWLAVLAAPAALAGWQISQRLAAGETPAGVLAAYLSGLGLLAVMKKWYSALALAAHLGWIVFPAAAVAVAPGIWSLAAAAPALPVALLLHGYLWPQRLLLAVSLAAGFLVLARWAADLWKLRAKDDGFLAAWGLAFFAGAVAVFFAGAARYLLPLAPALIFTVMRGPLRPRLLWPAAALNLALGLALASANYQYVEQYRSFAAALRPLAAGRRVWSGAEWGLRYYLEQIGAEPLVRDQTVYPGSLVVESELAGRVPFSTGGGRRRPVLQKAILAKRPFRLIGLGCRSGYSSSSFGVLPFDPGGGLLDRVEAAIIEAVEPRLSYLRMNDPAAADQLLSGFYQIEDHAWRWMSGEAAVTLKAPDRTAPFEMAFAIPDKAPARRITAAMNGIVIADRTYPGPGRYALSVAASAPPGAVVQVVVAVDKTFQPRGDQRRLGVIVESIGWKN